MKQTKQRGEVVEQLRSILTELGPMTTSEICQVLGMQKDEVSSVLARMKKKLPKCEQRVHICGYTYDCEGARRYPRAIYAVGPGVNVPHPKPDPKENKRRYNANKTKKVNSVWMLGMTRTARREIGFAP